MLMCVRVCLWVWIQYLHLYCVHVIPVRTHGNSLARLNESMYAQVQMCQNNAQTYVYVYLSQCVYVPKHMWVCPWNPEAAKASWHLSAPRQSVHCSGILWLCSLWMWELTSGGYQSDKQARQYNQSVCSLPAVSSVCLRNLVQIFDIFVFSTAVPSDCTVW